METIAGSWSDAWVTPLGAVTCELLSDLPMVVRGNTLMLGERLKIQREVHSLPYTWYAPSMPPKKPIEEVRCWRWHIECLQPSRTEDFQLFCGIKDRTEDQWYWSTGERLAAIETNRNGYNLHIGTEDEDSLACNVWDRKNKTPRWVQEVFRLDPLEISYWSAWKIDLVRDGLLVQVPPLQEGDHAYVHFLSAFEPLEEASGANAKNAVDRHRVELDDLLSVSTGPRKPWAVD
jgi:hypothetical protein